MITFIFAIAAGISNAVMACTLKGAQNAECRIVPFGTVSMTLAALLAFAFIPVVQGSYSILGGWILGVVLGFLMSSAIASAILANREGPPSLVWCMANLGLIVPIALAAIFQNEPLRVSDTFLLGNFTLMLWMFKRGMRVAGDFSDGHSRPWRYVILLVVVFLCNGLLMFGFKLNEMLYPALNKACFVAAFYSGASMAFLLSGVFLKRHAGLHPRTCELKWGAMTGVFTVSAVLFLQAAMCLPAIVVFPIVQGIALIGGVVLMALIYKERINKFKAVGIALGFAMIIQSILRDSQANKPQVQDPQNEAKLITASESRLNIAAIKTQNQK